MPARRAPLRSVARPSRPRYTGPSKRVRELVYQRDGHMCVCCGTTDQLTTGHRKNRGQGGSSDPAINRMSNLITQCATENLASEADPAMQQRALDKGWKVRSHQDPRFVRCWIVGEGPMFLLDDGSKTYSPVVARAAR